MKKLVNIFLIALIIGLTGFMSCEKTDDIQIDWVKTTIGGNLVNSYVTYAYSGGVMVSWNWHGKLMVTGEESGEIKITAYGPDNEKTCKEFVQSGKTYKVTVKGGMSSSGSGCDIFLESSSFQTIKIISTDFKTSVLEIAIGEAD